MAAGWCHLCCTRHAEGAACPWPLEATGCERPGWRINVGTPEGMESETGMFVITNTPADAGRQLELVLPRERGPVQLRGVVCWQRATPHAGRPPGMGIRLEAPPLAYLEYVRALP